MSLHDIAEAVADEQQIDARCLEQGRETRIIAGERGDLFARRAHPREVAELHRLAIDKIVHQSGSSASVSALRARIAILSMSRVRPR